MALIVLFGLLLSGAQALVLPSASRTRCAVPQMCAAQKTSVDVAAAASALQLELVESFLLATERGDAVTLMTMCTDDFLYKTHRATTTTLADAEERFHTKVPPPTKVTTPLGAGAEPDTFERVINVKPVPFVNVNVHQLFTVRGNKLARAEYIKL